MGPEIVLTRDELELGASAGVMRQIRRLEDGSVHRWGYAPTPELEWGNHVCAALAELAVAKALGLYWADRPLPDVDGDIAAYFVRWTRHEHGGLILRREDKAERVYVLACGAPPAFRLPGWILAAEGQSERYLEALGHGRPRCYRVPQSALHPIGTLRAAVELGDRRPA